MTTSGRKPDPRTGRSRNDPLPGGEASLSLIAKEGWSQAELADRVRVSRNSINAIENGRFDPSLPLAFRIADAFDLSVEDVFDKTDA